MTMGTSTQGAELADGTPAWHDDATVVVVGSGAAGLMAAVELAGAGVDTMVLSRGRVTDSSTDWAQGGLAAVWSDQDSPDLHVSDTLTAGAGLCAEDSVRILVNEAPAALRRLIELGAVFDKDRTGGIDLHLEGGHHARRILHAGGDQSGHEVERTLVQCVADAVDGPLSVREGVRAVDLLVDAQGRCNGVRALDAQGRLGEVRAASVILATGGIGQLWTTSTNPPVATGDGLAMAWRAGAVLSDLEFMQFHPTILVVPADHRIPGDRGVLISEAVRGEGAFLIDHRGTRVMAGLHPLADLAPRDVVSAAEHAHMARTGERNLFLDATAFGAQAWEHKFPSILAMCRERGVDPVTEPIPVRPGAHYHCGGVRADMDGRTSIEGLFAIGEVACTGVQGANRLASNSLTEGLTMGRRVARLIATGKGVPTGPASGGDAARRQLPPQDPALFDAVRRTMTAAGSVLRDARGLDNARRALADRATPAGTLTNATLDATNAAQVAELLLAAAALRRESRGSHRRSDFTERSAQWQCHQDWSLDAHGLPEMTIRTIGHEQAPERSAA
ncbi:L-aspartate oxidase [Propionibacterium freudenreichii]|nr:L-aspartate oxidase [Propionibacterium freudenreichii]MDK9360021.1 L-aspartate oxidase [Propionibacterium freudenreichii]MDK9639185.1 L-aspartate oxidase [Propionibacterium freudenreichii]MDK9659477.1 L-aspartate oxidase [Propionibacterium freudenreichii]SCQ62465.1 L-aspartate oxidase nadB [Propionibacterium freudenreichii]